MQILFIIQTYTWKATAATIVTKKHFIFFIQAYVDDKEDLNTPQNFGTIYTRNFNYVA